MQCSLAMVVATEDSCERLGGTEQFFGAMETTDLQTSEVGGAEIHDDAPAGVTGEMQDSQWQVISSDLFGLQQHDDVSYSPSIRTDFSGFLPEFSPDDDLNLAEGYNTEAVVQSAWKSLTAETPKLPSERNFWEKFLDPTVSAMDMLEKGFKRPLPAPIWEDTNSAPSTEIDRRVFPKPFQEVKGFLQHVRDIPERSWREEREAVWETAVRRWVALTDDWVTDCSALITALHHCSTFKEKAQILVDVFYNKAPQTLMKRVNSLQKMCSALKEEKIRFPCSEEQFYSFLKQESARGAPASRLKSFFEALVFVRYLLGVESLQALTESRRCTGAAFSRSLSCPRQADPFTVTQLKIFHTVLRESEEIWNRVMAGMVLFCVYARARWSDAQHTEELIEDRDSEQLIQFLEAKTAVHKTARAFHVRHQYLPMAAPSYGVTDDNWGFQWTHARRVLKIDDLSKYPLMPAPDSTLEPTRRPLSTQEAKLWMHELLGDHVGKASKVTSHSCKCTCLSFLAKRGASFEDRLVLGYHANSMKMALVYSRDSAARPLALLAHVLSEIKQGVFDPDCTRSGRLKANAIPLDQVEAVSFNPKVQQFQRVGSSVQNVENMSDGSWQKITVEGSTELETEDLGQGHITTDSSDSSESECRAYAPVIGHYLIDVPADKKLWLNKNSRMFHLSGAEYVKVLLCGRRITSGFREHQGEVRYDSAKCKACFRLKDS